MSDKTYNGWSSYETWLVKLWMDNEEGTYNYWQAATVEVWEEAEFGGNAWVTDRLDRALEQHG